MKAVHETLHNGKPVTVVHNNVEEFMVSFGLPNRPKLRPKLRCKCCGREWFPDMFKAHIVSKDIEDELNKHYSNIVFCDKKLY